jgi:S1-C subfamily serine protease
MQLNRSKTPWIVCGVIGVLAFCGVIALVSGGVLLAALGDTTPTPELKTAKIETKATEVEQPLSTAVSGVSTGGTVSGNRSIPYKAVVQIIAMVKLEGGIEPGWTGSGSIVSPDGLILTNGHVVLSDRYYTVDHLVIALTSAPDEPPVPTYIANIMQVDKALDIAVLRVETDLAGIPVDRAALNLPTVSLGDDASLNLGDPLVILGYPSIGGTTITLTSGEVSGFTAQEGYGNRAFIKTSATISGGNSGGLAANDQGELIGVPTQLGYGGDDQFVDCRVLVDTNRDGAVDEADNCVPTGGFINALRPLTLARPYIEAASRGEVNLTVEEAASEQQGSLPVPLSGNVLYQDDFSYPDSGWTTDAWDEGEVGYVDGKYQVTVTPTEYLVWSYVGDSFSDSVFSTETSLIAPTGEADFGIICRLQDDDNFYAMEVSEDGYFTIWKKVGGETISLYDWEYSASIPVDGTFTINAGCVGSTLTLAVNDIFLASVNDDSFQDGNFGVIAGTYETGGFSVGFDNFTVYEP